LAIRIAKGQPLESGSAEALTIKRRDKARRFLESVEAAGRTGGKPAASVIARRTAAFEEALELNGRDISGSLAAALVESYLDEFESGGPRPFLQKLGRTAGLLFPPFAGRSKEKRISPSVTMLDTLVRACVPVGELIPVEDAFQALWLRFGLIVGGRVNTEPTDLELLERTGIQLDPTDLDENVELFVDECVRLGLARRYADNVSLIGDAYAG
jgi:hypothetical protein